MSTSFILFVAMLLGFLLTMNQHRLHDRIMKENRELLSELRKCEEKRQLTLAQNFDYIRSNVDLQDKLHELTDTKNEEEKRCTFEEKE